MPSKKVCVLSTQVRPSNRSTAVAVLLAKLLLRRLVGPNPSVTLMTAPEKWMLWLIRHLQSNGEVSEE